MTLHLQALIKHGASLLLMSEGLNKAIFCGGLDEGSESLWILSEVAPQVLCVVLLFLLYQLFCQAPEIMELLRINVQA